VFLHSTIIVCLSLLYRHTYVYVCVCSSYWYVVGSNVITSKITSPRNLIVCSKTKIRLPLRLSGFCLRLKSFIDMEEYAKNPIMYSANFIHYNSICHIMTNRLNLFPPMGLNEVRILALKVVFLSCVTSC